VIRDGNGTVVAPNGTATLTSIERLRFVDGTRAYGADTPEAQVVRLYDAAFGRAPDASGLAYWSGVLQGGASIAGVASVFSDSGEFRFRAAIGDWQAGNGIIPETDQARSTAGASSAFVAALYRDILGREPDPAGSAFWTNEIDTGTESRAEVLAGFSESTENRARDPDAFTEGLWSPDPTAASVARLYYTALDRAPDGDGLVSWAGYISGRGATLAQVAELVMASDEFTLRSGGMDDAEFVNMLYGNALDRAPDDVGLQAWTEALAHGASRSLVAVTFSDSTEVKARLSSIIEDHGIVLA
jgi:hypothetical protein